MVTATENGYCKNTEDMEEKTFRDLGSGFK